HGGKRPWRTRIILALTTLLPIILIFWQFGWQQLFAFALAMAFTICLHLGWRRQLATGKTA
ncbi:MAG: hypothetical protein KC443_13500, partial [Anaerolineales bacterium]|nr:hypothetical protein [Anaerolineales bacterium]